MRKTTYWSEILDDGPEICFAHTPIDGTVLQQKVGDRYVVAYLVTDYYPPNPMKELDCNGELITEKQGVITDGNAAAHLGLQEFGGRFCDMNRDYELDGIEELVETKLRDFIAKSEELRTWFVQLRFELDQDPIKEIIDLIQGYFYNVEWSDDDREMATQLPSWESMAEEAWNELYEEGKIGTYLAVPVNYCDNVHGPGTTQINTTSIDNANAVWIPSECEIGNMNFDGCKTYFDKLKVADKYAQSCLDEYEKWCNGDVYGCVVETFDEQGEQIDEDSCWCFFGWEYAEESLNNEFFEPTCRYVAEKYTKDVHTQCGRQQEMTL